MGNLKKLIKQLIYTICRVFPIKKNRILFFSYYGERYSGSPKYLSEYFVSQTDSNPEIVWAFVHPEKYELDSGICKVKYGSISYYFMLATAKIIITNYRMTEEFHKKKGQIYIQTWHSSLRLKMIEKDAEQSLPEHYVRMAKRDSEQLDYLLTGSQKGKEIFERSFWYKGNILEVGTPQCDILFETNNDIHKKVCDYFNMPLDTKFILYAPTFRKNHSLDVYNLDYDSILDAVSERIEGNWVFLLRLHPHLVNLIDNLSYGSKVLQATQYDEAQELLSVADILISDYSAIMFDYAVTKKPCFLYVPDLEEYTKKDRNLYFNIKELPFECAETNDELIQKIKLFDEEQYKEKTDIFLQDTIHSYDDGCSCKKVWEKIKEIIGE